MSADADILPTKNLHQNVAHVARLRGGEQRRDHFLHRQAMRTGQHEARRPLLQKELLQRRKLVQDGILNRCRQLMQKAFQPLDDVKKERLIHTRSSSQLRSFHSNARALRRARGIRFHCSRVFV